MKLFNNKIKLLQNKKIIFLIIFAIGIGVLIYQTYIMNNQTSIIERFDIGGIASIAGIAGIGGNSNTNSTSRIAEIISNFFKPSCLTGCVSPNSERDSKCDKIYDDNDKFHYECSWKCDINKFDDYLKERPELKLKLEGYKRCKPETEDKDCGSCRPRRTFYN